MDHSNEDQSTRGLEKNPVVMSVPGEARPSEASAKPGFLWDDTRFVLGWHGDKNKDPKSFENIFTAFVERHNRLLPEISSPQFGAVCSFLNQWSPADAVNQPKLLEIGKGRCVFRILGRTGYASTRTLLSGSGGANIYRSIPMRKAIVLVTGLDEKQDIARLHLGIFRFAGYALHRGGPFLFQLRQLHLLRKGKERQFIRFRLSRVSFWKCSECAVRRPAESSAQNTNRRSYCGLLDGIQKCRRGSFC